jgi:hypothetical protein
VNFVEGCFNGGMYTSCTKQHGSAILKGSSELACFPVDGCSLNQCGHYEQCHNADQQKSVSLLEANTPCTNALQFAASPEQTSSLCPRCISVDSGSERRRILTTNPAELSPSSRPVYDDSDQQHLFAVSIMQKLTPNGESNLRKRVSEVQPINPKRRWQALARKVLGFAWGYDGRKGSTEKSKGHYGGDDRLMLQGSCDKINSSKNNTADNCCEGNNLLTKGGSVVDETEDTHCDVPEQQLTNRFWAVTDLEQLASAYLDIDDGQNESKEVSDSDLSEHNATRTLNHAQSNTKWDSKRQSEFLTESERHKRYKNSALCLVSRESGSEQTCLYNNELLQQRSVVTSTVGTISSKSDYLCIESRATLEEDNWDSVVCSEGREENDPMPSTLQEKKCSSSTLLLPRANLKVNPNLSLPSSQMALPSTIPMLVSVTTPCFAESESLSRILSSLACIIILLS